MVPDGSTLAAQGLVNGLQYLVLATSCRISSLAEVRACFATALANIKPTDALIVGMYRRFGDQMGTNAALVRELCAKSLGTEPWSDPCEDGGWRIE